jgi:hypothetical protein
MRFILYFVVLLLPCTIACSQHVIKVGSQIPIQYAAQYDFLTSKHFSVNAQLGILTKPYDQVILNILESFGVSEEVVDVLTYAFDFGLVSQMGVNYHFKKNYLGVTGSWIHLRASDTPVAIMESAYNVDVSSYPTRPKQNTSSPITITLASELFTTGILYGRRFNFKNPRVELHTELGFAKVIASKNYVDSAQRSLTNLSALVDEELDDDYLAYGYLPSINLFLVYKLSKS